MDTTDTTQEDTHLIDLQDGTHYKVPAELDFISVGLTVNDSIICEPQGKEDKLVIRLCLLMKKKDGYWLVSNPDLPCLVNDRDVNEPLLLSRGSTIKVGDRFFRYSEALRSKWNNSEPPPKPKRSATPDEMISPEDFSLGDNTVSEEWCIVSAPPTLNEELLDQLCTPDQVANLAASYLSRQMLMHTDIVLTTKDMDNIFKAVQEVTSLHEDVMLEFAVSYKNQVRTEQVPSVLPYSPTSLHAPVIHLLTDLLKLSLAPVRESGIQLIVRALQTFNKEISVVRPACKALANLTTMLSGLLQDIHDKAVERPEPDKDIYIGILEFLQEHGLVPVMEASRLYSDVSVYCDCKRIINFFEAPLTNSVSPDEEETTTEDIPEGDKCSDKETDSDLEPATVILTKDVPVLNEHKERQLELLSCDSTSVIELKTESTQSLQHKDTDKEKLYEDNQSQCLETYSHDNTDYSQSSSKDNENKPCDISSEETFSLLDKVDMFEDEKEYVEVHKYCDKNLNTSDSLVSNGIVQVTKKEFNEDSKVRSRSDTFTSGESKDLRTYETDCDTNRKRSDTFTKPCTETDLVRNSRSDTFTLSNSESEDLITSRKRAGTFTKTSDVTGQLRDCDKLVISDPAVAHSKENINSNDVEISLCTEAADSSLSRGSVNTPRSQWGSVQRLDISLLMKNGAPSLEASMDYAVLRSSCSLDEVNLEFIDPTVEAEVRQNRTAWKSVMEELKLQMIFSPDSDGKPHVTYQQNISAFDIQAGVEKVATAKDMDFTDEELLTYATCVEEEHSSVSMQLSARNMIIKHIRSTLSDGDKLSAIEILKSPLSRELVNVEADKQIIQYYRKERTGFPSVAEADPALSLNVLQELAQGEVSSDQGVKLLRYLSDLLNTKHHPRHIERASSCIHDIISGPLAVNIQQGWGFFTLKSLHKIASSLLTKKKAELGTSCRESVSCLLVLLDKLITAKE